MVIPVLSKKNEAHSSYCSLASLLCPPNPQQNAQMMLIKVQVCSNNDNLWLEHIKLAKMKASLSGKGNISMVWQKGVVFIFMLSFFSFPSFILCVCINIVVVTQHRLEPQSQCGTQMSICKSPAIEKSAHTMWTSKQWYSRRVEISSCGKLINSEGMEVSILESLSWKASYTYFEWIFDPSRPDRFLMYSFLADQ